MTIAAGTKLGPYEIVSPIGAGGMGEVYRARDARLGREVAIKVLPAELSLDADRLKRFEREARAASSLNHPNIVTIYEVDRTDSTSFIAMELVGGKPLREVLAGGALPARKILDIGKQIAEGLAKAHSAGIVHRDLKPENVMITNDGLVKILDFGLAKLAHPEVEGGLATEAPTVSEGTRPGIVMGTVSYMSPEQASAHPVDFRSDQFSFGSILYEMATGKRAFSRPTAAQTMAAIIQDEPEPIANLNPSLPAPVRWIAERCLAKEARERYASTEDLARDLSTLRAHLSEASSSGAALAIDARPRRSRLAPILGLLLLLGVLAGVFVLGERVAEKPFPSFQRLTFRRGGVWSARFAPDGHTVVYGAAWDGDPIRLFSTRTEGRESTRFEFPDADVAAVSSTGEAAILFGRPFGRPLWGGGTLARVPLGGGAPREIAEDVIAADWSADGKSLAVARRVGPRSRIEFPVGKVLHETNDLVAALRVSPTGNRIAFISRRTATDYSVRVVDLAGTVKTLTPGWRWTGVGLAWSPDGREVWFSGNEGGWVNPIRAVSLSGKQRIVLNLPAWLTVQDISADRRVLITMGYGRGRMFGLAPGETQERDLSWHESSQIEDIAADGKTVLFMEPGEGSSLGNTAYVRGTDGSPAKRIGVGGPIAMSPDGRWAAMIDLGRPSHLLLVPTGVGETRVLDGGDKEYINGQWFPDGKRILVAARVPGRPGGTYAQDVAGGPLRPVGPGGTGCGSISPDGKEAICGTNRYPVEGGSPKPVPGLQPEDEVIQWSEDGRALYVLRLEGVRAKVFRHDLATGADTLWREFVPPERAGLSGNLGLVMTPDARAYAYTYFYTPSDLYLVTGLQ